MTWMGKWRRLPLFLESAHGATLTDVDGHEYVDFALGDTGAMAATPATDRGGRAGADGARRDDDDAPDRRRRVVGAELARRFACRCGPSP